MAFGTTGDISRGRRGWTTCDPLRRLTAHVGRPTLRFMPAPHPQSWTEVRPQGLYIAPGGFYVDPLRAVDRAVVTHGHSDHARAGHGAVLATAETLAIMDHRLGDQAGRAQQALAYGEVLRVGDVEVSLHPAGHVLGSAQVCGEIG